MKQVALILFLALAACASGPAQTPAKMAETTATPTAQSLLGTEWLLEDLGGAGVLEGVQATLAFPEAGRVAGSGSCNRFTGSATIGPDSAFSVGQLASTRRACEPAVMDQETIYLGALESAERIALEGPYLLVFSKDLEKPMRFTRKT